MGKSNFVDQSYLHQQPYLPETSKGFKIQLSNILNIGNDYQPSTIDFETNSEGITPITQNIPTCNGNKQSNVFFAASTENFECNPAETKMKNSSIFKKESSKVHKQVSDERYLNIGRIGEKGNEELDQSNFEDSQVKQEPIQKKDQDELLLTGLATIDKVKRIKELSK